MNRLFSLLMAAFLCCSLQNLNAESAEQAAEALTGPGQSDGSIKYSPQIQADLNKMSPAQKKNGII